MSNKEVILDILEAVNTLQAFAKGLKPVEFNSESHPHLADKMDNEGTDVALQESELDIPEGEVWHAIIRFSDELFFVTLRFQVNGEHYVSVDTLLSETFDEDEAIEAGTFRALLVCNDWDGARRDSRDCRKTAKPRRTWRFFI